LIGAVDEADHGDDRGDANDDADQREHAAELVSPETARGDSYGFG